MNQLQREQLQMNQVKRNNLQWTNFCEIRNNFSLNLLDYQGCIQIENGSIQMLWMPKKISPKRKKEKGKLFLPDKFLK